jgi:hypothetical protein
MSTVTTALTGPVAEATRRQHPIRRAALVSGAVAALATTAVAATAHAADVPLAIDGETIPLAGFAQMTLLGAVLGGLLAAAFNRFSATPRRWFLTVAVALTVLSCVPSVALPDDAATKIVLVATHVVAAFVIVPALARRTHR